MGYIYNMEAFVQKSNLPMCLAGSLKQEDEVVFVPNECIRAPREDSTRKRFLKPSVETAIRLFYAGFDLQEVEKLTGVKRWKIRGSLRTERGKQLQDKIQGELDDEFRALYGLSIQALKQGLTTGDVKDKVSTADKYLKFAKEMKVKIEFTAEDLVQKIMRGR